MKTVDVRPVPHSDKFVAWCNVPGCKEWSTGQPWCYVNSVKSDVATQATNHRQNKHTPPGRKS